jgi:hypothetical protein
MRDAAVGEPLRALLQVITEQVNIVEEDIAQLYENWFIETCEDWVVPYIGDLIGYLPVREAGEPGEVTTDRGRALNKILIPRREVAQTIAYRRRKGTLALLELLAADVAGWPVRAVQFYELLGITQHLNHLHPERGRVLDLRDGDALDLMQGPFDSAAHTVDVRRINSQPGRGRGRYNIPSVGIFAWKLKSYSITRAPAKQVDRARHQYTFSVLGNNVQLFTNPRREADPTDIAGPLNVPDPIRRRAFDRRKRSYYGGGKSLQIWRDNAGQAVPHQNIVPADLSKWAYRPQDDQVAVDPVLGRIVFAPRTAPKEGVWVSYQYGFSADMGGGEYHRDLSSHSGKRVYLVGERLKPGQGYQTITAALEAWSRESPEDAAVVDEAIIEITDSGSYVERPVIELRANQRLEIRAANGTRPSIHLRDIGTSRSDEMLISGTLETTVPQSTEQEPGNEYEGETEEQDEPDDPPQASSYRGRAPVQQSEPYGGEKDAYPGGPGEPDEPVDEATGKCAPRLALDGLLIEGRSLRISGELSEVSIRHCTLVPGWSLGDECEPQSGDEPSLELDRTSARLVIERSILGSIYVSQDEVNQDPNRISISDSILDATDPGLGALTAPDDRLAHATLVIERSTVFGRVWTHAIDLAQDSIFAGEVRVARRQRGCMRFCYVQPGSRTPQRYNCQPDGAVSAAEAAGEPKDWAELRVRPRFNSVRYGTATYCQLAEDCPQEIERGASDQSEMGAFHDLFNPQREANLQARLDEYTPAGTDVGIVLVT